METLNLSHHSVLKNYKNLTALNFSDNFLNGIPSYICKLKKLKLINLSHNNLNSFDLDEAPPNLKVLDLSFNCLKEVYLLSESLEVLYLNNNNIKCVDCELYYAVNLKELDLSFNEMENIPSGIFDMRNLRELNLSNNHICKIPKEIEKLAKLTHINLSNNCICRIPKEIGKLVDLTHINLSKNCVSEIPKEITKLTKLVHISLWKYVQSDIPKEITKSVNSKCINLLKKESKKKYFDSIYDGKRKYSSSKYFEIFKGTYYELILFLIFNLRDKNKIFYNHYLFDFNLIKLIKKYLY